MTFDIEIAGRRRAVTIDATTAGSYRVVIDGEAHGVRAERAGHLAYSIIMDDGSERSREVTVAPGSATGELLVGIGGRAVNVTVDGRRRRVVAEGTHAAGDQSVTAPMPGRIARVLVGPGDAVAARQAVVVVEAMKMENELRSPRAGRVKDVTVTAGALVEAGRVLVIIE